MDFARLDNTLVSVSNRPACVAVVRRPSVRLGTTLLLDVRLLLPLARFRDTYLGVWGKLGGGGIFTC